PDTEDAMSEQPEPNQPEPEDTPDEQLGENGLKALQSEREARKAAEDELKELRKLKPLAQKWMDAEEANKSEIERAREEAANATAAAEAARTEALRYRIANKHKSSDEDAEVFLTASDEEALERQATRLAEIADAKREDDRRRPDPSQGARKPAVKDAW